MQKLVYLLAGFGLGLLLTTSVAADSGVSPLAVLKSAAGQSGEREFLDPEDAFKVIVDATDAKTLRAHWDVADGYYLYHQRFSFSIKGDGMTLGQVMIPAGEMEEDPTFGRVEIMLHQFDILLPLQRQQAIAQPVQLTMNYQGCAKDGICYPPIHKTLTINLPASAGGLMPTSTTLLPGTNDTDHYSSILAHGSLWNIAGVFFLIGLVLAFTPCVYPMVPILSGLIVGQQAYRGRALVLSLVYVIAMACTYALAGVAAGSFGQNLQAWFQQPALLVAFALIFVILALSMFGVFTLQLPARWQTWLSAVSGRQRGGSLIGAGVMGVFSALIVGPCVAPPLAGALIYIGQNGNAVLGGFALFAMALGMGLPLLLVGASAGALLPRAGAWMDAIKRFFGFVMLGVAIWFLSRLLPGHVILLLWALLALTAGVFMGTFTHTAHSGGGRQTAKALGLALSLYGVLMLVGVATGGQDPFHPLQKFSLASGAAASAARPTPVFTPVHGSDELKSALTQAAGKPVMLDLYADWCVECKRLERETFTDQTVQKALQGAVLLRADVTANDATDQSLLKDLGLFGPPAILFFDGEGRERRTSRLQGFVEPAPFIKHLDNARAPCSAPETLAC
ncbi:MAG TPA: protein-disulfide reductase DsbD [Gammaproteobacteria bacterium]|nr:protein-disulfide reductase DsbD [Gammaproteobacteria bacterium]